MVNLCYRCKEPGHKAMFCYKICPNDKYEDSGDRALCELPVETTRRDRLNELLEDGLLACDFDRQLTPRLVAAVFVLVVGANLVAKHGLVAGLFAAVAQVHHSSDLQQSEGSHGRERPGSAVPGKWHRALGKRLRRRQSNRQPCKAPQSACPDQRVCKTAQPF